MDVFKFDDDIIRLYMCEEESIKLFFCKLFVNPVNLKSAVFHLSSIPLDLSQYVINWAFSKDKGSPIHRKVFISSSAINNSLLFHHCKPYYVDNKNIQISFGAYEHISKQTYTSAILSESF